MKPPAMSVVVGLISGRVDDLRRCLQALHAQDVDWPVEILVPYDAACGAVAGLAAEFPAVRFLAAEGLDTAAARQGHSREHHDTLRTIGLRAAVANIIALTEDHAHVASDWCREMAGALDRYPRAAAIGGAVECGSDRVLSRAVWFCDFGRYQNPLPDGPADFVSDSNVAYRRQALEQIAAAWRNDYHETVVHEAMRAAGFELRTTPRAVAWQARGRLRFADVLRERLVWARSFAGTRAALVGSRRWLYALLTPALPAVLTWRLLRLTAQRGRHTARLLRLLPLILLLQSAWAVGEFVGYVTGTPAAGQPPRGPRDDSGLAQSRPPVAR